MERDDGLCPTSKLHPGTIIIPKLGLADTWRFGKAIQQRCCLPSEVTFLHGNWFPFSRNQLLLQKNPGPTLWLPFFPEFPKPELAAVMPTLLCFLSSKYSCCSRRTFVQVENRHSFYTKQDLLRNTSAHGWQPAINHEAWASHSQGRHHFQCDSESILTHQSMF